MKIDLIWGDCQPRGQLGGMKIDPRQPNLRGLTYSVYTATQMY